MKPIIFLLLFGSLSACEKKRNESLSKNIMQQKSIIDLVENNNLEAVKVALEKGENVNTKDGKGRSLLLIATINKQVEMAQLLVSHHADVNLQDDQLDSPFLYAGATGQTELVKLFLNHGARFDVFNRYNGSALIPACERGHVETVRVLVNTGNFPINYVNRLGWTALMEAVILGDGGIKHQQIVQILKDKGVDLSIPDKDGVTALQHAKSLEFTEIVTILES